MALEWAHPAFLKERSLLQGWCLMLSICWCSWLMRRCPNAHGGQVWNQQVLLNLSSTSEVWRCQNDWICAFPHEKQTLCLFKVCSSYSFLPFFFMKEEKSENTPSCTWGHICSTVIFGESKPDVSLVWCFQSFFPLQIATVTNPMLRNRNILWVRSEAWLVSVLPLLLMGSGEKVNSFLRPLMVWK